MAGGEDGQVLQPPDRGAGDHIDLADAVDLVPEKLHPDGRVLPVGWPNLHRVSPDPEHIPCFRVVNAKGELAGAFAFGGEQTQAKLLEEDGVEVIDGKVDLKKYGIEMI
mgnify:CR=1 FL=1